MVEKVTAGELTLAIIVRAGFRNEGVAFLTEPDAILQMGYMSHPAGYRIAPHVHRPYTRQTSGTHEVLYVKSGRVLVEFFDDAREYVASRELAAGDWIVLVSGGHGFEILEDAVMIEVKNGPYAGDRDKVRFEREWKA